MGLHKVEKFFFMYKTTHTEQKPSYTIYGQQRHRSTQASARFYVHFVGICLNVYVLASVCVQNGFVS